MADLFPSLGEYKESLCVAIVSDPPSFLVDDVSNVADRDRVILSTNPRESFYIDSDFKLSVRALFLGYKKAIPLFFSLRDNDTRISCVTLLSSRARFQMSFVVEIFISTRC